jgi:hypothetical protein
VRSTWREPHPPPRSPCSRIRPRPDQDRRSDGLAFPIDPPGSDFNDARPPAQDLKALPNCGSSALAAHHAPGVDLAHGLIGEGASVVPAVGAEQIAFVRIRPRQQRLRPAPHSGLPRPSRPPRAVASRGCGADRRAQNAQLRGHWAWSKRHPCSSLRIWGLSLPGYDPVAPGVLGLVKRFVDPAHESIALLARSQFGHSETRRHAVG